MAGRMLVTTIAALAACFTFHLAHAMPADAAQKMCESFADNHPEQERRAFVTNCLSNLTIDKPTPRSMTGGTGIVGAGSAVPEFLERLGVVTSLFKSVWLLVVVCILYFVPTVVAVARKKLDRLAIFVLNLFLGWTFVGWVLALVWATMHDRDHIQQQATP